MIHVQVKERLCLIWGYWALTAVNRAAWEEPQADEGLGPHTNPHQEASGRAGGQTVGFQTVVLTSDGWSEFLCFKRSFPLPSVQKKNLSLEAESPSGVLIVKKDTISPTPWLHPARRRLYKPYMSQETLGKQRKMSFLFLPSGFPIVRTWILRSPDW